MAPQPSSRHPSHTHSPDNQPPQLVDPRWILKALAAVFALALVCAYVLLCLTFYFQQWQLVLHPSRVVSHDPSFLGLQSQEVHFAPDATGQPQLDGWWIPADLPNDPTALVLHSGEGSMSDALPLARTLHDARMNVLLFDYRGFGRSTGGHPAERTMEVDSDSALHWLQAVKHIAPSQIVLVGDRLGASLAVRLCTQHADIAALILQQGDGDFATRTAADQRSSRIVPFRLLFHEDFPLADPLHTLKTPKLLISFTEDKYPVDVRRAAGPKMTYEIGHEPTDSARHEGIRRFLDAYLTQPVPAFIPLK